ncbi:MAG: STAS domain-containing protein, partial [Fidelibacterota bacterium]
DKDKISILNLKGFLDAHTASDFEKRLQELIDERRYRIILNFKGLNYISSAGLGVIMGFVEEVRNNGGDIKLVEMNDRIFRVFDLVGFPSLYEIYSEQSQAEEKFTGKN